MPWGNLGARQLRVSTTARTSGVSEGIGGPDLIGGARRNGARSCRTDPSTARCLMMRPAGLDLTDDPVLELETRPRRADVGNQTDRIVARSSEACLSRTGPGRAWHRHGEAPGAPECGAVLRYVRRGSTASSRSELVPARSGTPVWAWPRLKYPLIRRSRRVTPRRATRALAVVPACGFDFEA